MGTLELTQRLCLLYSRLEVGEAIDAGQATGPRRLEVGKALYVWQAAEVQQAGGARPGQLLGLLWVRSWGSVCRTTVMCGGDTTVVEGGGLTGGSGCHWQPDKCRWCRRSLPGGAAASPWETGTEWVNGGVPRERGTSTRWIRYNESHYEQADNMKQYVRMRQNNRSSRRYEYERGIKGK